MPEAKTVYTACQGYGCHEHCIITTITNEEGVIDRCERMTVPEGLQEQFHGNLEERCGICHKGVISGKLPYVPERVLYPLKRVGKRGDGEFERISWDQALDEIAEKLLAIREQYGPRSVLVQGFPCGLPGAPLSMPMQFRFQMATDASLFDLEGVDEAVLKMPAMYWGNGMVVFDQDTTLLYNADYILIWGGNPIGFSRSAYTSRAIMTKIDEGVKAVNIGMLFDSSAAKASQFVQVKPATDGALALSMVHEIIENEWYDTSFLLNHTVAPFLVRQDNGRFLRGRDIVEGSSSENYVAVAKGTTETLIIAPNELETEQAELSAEITINGISCKTAFLMLKEHCISYTPEWQEQHTGVSPEVVKQIVKEYVSHENACLYLMAGLRYKNSVAAGRAIALLPMLTGKYHNATGGILCEPNLDSFPVQLNDFALLVEGLDNPGGAYALLQDILASFDDPEMQQYKAFINTFQNPVHNWPPRKMWEEEFFPNMELVVVFEYRLTETTMFADYVLPDTMTFEREEINIRGGCLILQEAAIEPLGEAREEGMVICDLATRMGFGKYFDKTHDEMLECKLQSNDPAVASVEPPITLSRLRKEKIIPLNTPNRQYNMYTDRPLRTPSGRHEFYIDRLADLPGGALMTYDKALIQDVESRKKYPLHLFVGRSRFFMQGQFREIPELRHLSGDGPRLGINREDAIARGINEGDLVEVFNDNGVVIVPVYFTRFIQPGQVHLWYIYGVKDYKLSGPATTLGAHLNIREAIDPISQAWGEIWKEQSSVPGVPETLSGTPGLYANETIWDVLCEVRRAEL